MINDVIFRLKYFRNILGFFYENVIKEYLLNDNALICLVR